MVARAYNISHAAYEWMVEECYDSSFSSSAYLLGAFGTLAISPTLLLGFIGGRAAGDDLDSNLANS